MSAVDIVVALVALWGGELIGRTRLQKGAYLLHCCGANFDLFFVYHHYGPYSFKLAAGCADAIEERRLEMEERRGQRGRYRVFKTGESRRSIGALSADDTRRIVQRLKDSTDLVLELAATIVFLREEGGYRKMEDAIVETRIRKVQKATDERMERALSLVHDLGLAPENAVEHPA